jgi:general L-amino acid transport system permease protein
MAVHDTSGPSGVILRPTRPPFWNDPVIRGIFFQVLLIGAVLALIAYLVHNTLANLASRSIATGFGFLQKESGFDVGESVIEYSPADTYGRAILVGLLNTIKLSVVGIVLCTILGPLIGVARLSKNWLVSKLAKVYVEVTRNIPVLLHLFFWITLVRLAPNPRDAIELLPGVYMMNRGVLLPVPFADPAHSYIGIAFLLGIILTVLVARWAKRRQEATGQQFPMVWAGIGLIIGLPLLVFFAAGAPLRLDIPVLKGFNFQGGIALTPEFFAMLVGLVVYTAGFVAEIVRSGIMAVSHGQTEAASALGLKPGLTLSKVVLPQALRVIVPPMTSQYLNITKNSSLAVLIGYFDLVSAANTTINQTGQAVEGIGIIMAVYLTMSLGISLFMNYYNARIALKER